MAFAVLIFSEVFGYIHPKLHAEKSVTYVCNPILKYFFLTKTFGGKNQMARHWLSICTFFKFFWPSQNLWTLLSYKKMFYLPKITRYTYIISKVHISLFLTKKFWRKKPDGKTLAVNLHFYLTFNTMLTVIINTFLQDSSFFTAKKKEK